MTFTHKEIPFVVDTAVASLKQPPTQQQWRKVLRYAQRAGGAGRTSRLLKKKLKALMRVWEYIPLFAGPAAESMKSLALAAQACIAAIDALNKKTNEELAS